LTIRAPRLKESIVYIRDVAPFIAVKRHAENELSRRHAGFEIPFDGGTGIVVSSGSLRDRYSGATKPVLYFQGPS